MTHSKTTCACRQINAARFLADLKLLREMNDACIPTHQVVRALDQLIAEYEQIVRETEHEHQY